MVKAIVFDLWGTLAEDKQPYAVLLKDVVKNPKALLKKFWLYGRSTWMKDGKGDAKPYIRDFCRSTGLEDKKFVAIMQKVWKASIKSGEWNPWVFELLPKLAKNYKIILASNTGIDGKRFIKNSPEVAENFSEIFLSFEHKVAKPDKDFFLLVQKATKCAPNLLKFYDDELPNCVAARNLGWDAIHFHGPKDLSEVLQ